MNPVLWGGVVVVLLVIFAAVTMGMTRWGRSELDHVPRPAHPNRGRVSGHDDD